MKNRRRFLAVLAGSPLVAAPSDGFRLALPGYEYRFPRDHFEHRDFQTEWWYFTGNVATADGRRFGYELTFFRHAAEPGPDGSATWSTKHIYLAHFAVSDVARQEFHKRERIQRGGPGLAGSDLASARLWNGNWQVRWTDPENPRGALELDAYADQLAVQVRLEPAKAAVIHGNNGVSQKGEGAGRASHYLSFTRLVTSGTLYIGDQRHEISGTTWMDQEFFTNSLRDDQAGWDWMSAQFDDGTELMLYRLRPTDPAMPAQMSGTFVDTTGAARYIPQSAITMRTRGKTWRSPSTGANYPLEWDVSIASLEAQLRCRTPFAAQEVVSGRGVSPSYWEGAVDYEGTRAGKEWSGRGYLEMTGYDERFAFGQL